MEIIVQKFGGTSVATPENREKCIDHIIRERMQGHAVVVVLSAMGRYGSPYATDTLISLLGNSEVGNKEKDLLLSTGEIISSVVFSSLLNAKGIQNTVLTGGQAGIITNDNYTSALINDVKPSRVMEELNKGNVVVVPGFQGITENGDITTLGRGGSDTSAAALAAGLKAKFVDIFTDVDGLMTADPRIVSGAQQLDTTSYEDVAQMAHSGAKVIHPRAVELAMKHDITMRIRSTFSNNEGTLISRKVFNEGNYDAKETIISGVVSNGNIHRYNVKKKGVQYIKGQFERLFSFLKEANISIDFINVMKEEVFFTVSISDSKKLETFLVENNYKFQKEENISKVSIIGSAINGVPGIMAMILEALSIDGTEVIQTSDSNTTIWLLISSDDEIKAIQAIHKRFFEI